MSKVTFHDLVVKLKELANELGKTPTLRDFTDSGVSRRQIDKYKYSKIVDAAGLQPNAHSKTTPPIEVVIKPPRILFFDIETAPITGYSWGIYEQNILKVINDWFVLSFSGRFLGEAKHNYMDQRNSKSHEIDKV